MNRSIEYAKRNIRRTPFQAIAASMVMFSFETEVMSVAASSKVSVPPTASSPLIVADPETPRSPPKFASPVPKKVKDGLTAVLPKVMFSAALVVLMLM